MKIEGILQTELPFALIEVQFGEKSGQDYGQISFPVLGDMNNDVDSITVTETSVDILFNLNEMPLHLFFEKSDNKWSGNMKLESLSLESALDVIQTGNVPCFSEHHNIIPPANIENLKRHNSYETENISIDSVFYYELGNQEVLQYINSKGISVTCNRDFSTAKVLMEKLCKRIHQDGVNYVHDSINRGTIAQMEFALAHNGMTNCRGIAIILSGILRAYGFKANYVECWSDESDTSDIHVVCEVYCEDLDKTVLMDPSSNLIYYLNEIPLSLIELKDALCRGKADEIYINEDATRKDGNVSKTEMLAYMSKNLIFLCKCIHSDESSEMDDDNSICLVPLDLHDNETRKASICTSNISMFYKI